MVNKVFRRIAEESRFTTARRGPQRSLPLNRVGTGHGCGEPVLMISDTVTDLNLQAIPNEGPVLD